MSVGVANGVEGSGKDVPVAVELKAGEQLEVLDGTQRTEKVSEGREGSVTFKLRAKRALGSANLIFFAGWKDKKSKQSIELSVRPFSPRLPVMTGRLSPLARSGLPPPRTAMRAAPRPSASDRGDGRSGSRSPA